MEPSRFFVATAVLAAAAYSVAAGAAEKRPGPKKVQPVKMLNTWSGKIADAALRKCAPTDEFLLDQDKWAKLPADVQKVFTDVSQEWIAKHGEAWDQADQAGREFVTGLKRQFIQLPEAEQQQWKSAVKPILDDFVKKAKEKNLPGETMLADIQAEVAKAVAAK